MPQPTYISSAGRTDEGPIWMVTNERSHMLVAVCFEPSHADLIVTALNRLVWQLSNPPLQPRPSLARARKAN